MILTETRPQAVDYAAARRAMIDSQLRTSGINDPLVLERMGAVPREDFVPVGARATAYIDRAIPLGNGRSLASPQFYGMLLTEANPAPEDSVLVVDGGSGYLAALVGPLVASVETVTPKQVNAGPGKRKQCTLVLVDGAIEHLPDTLADRMAQGARIVTGTFERGVTRLAIGRKSPGGVSLLALAEIGIPRLAEFDRAVGWSF